MMQSAELANSIVMAGHSYAMTYAASALSSVARQRELFSGMTQVCIRCDTGVYQAGVTQVCIRHHTGVYQV